MRSPITDHRNSRMGTICKCTCLVMLPIPLGRSPVHIQFLCAVYRCRHRTRSSEFQNASPFSLLNSPSSRLKASPIIPNSPYKSGLVLQNMPYIYTCDVAWIFALRSKGLEERYRIACGSSWLSMQFDQARHLFKRSSAHS